MTTAQQIYKLFKIHCIEPTQLIELLDSCNIHPAALLTLNSGPFHFQHFHKSTSSHRRYLSFGLAYNVATILWSCDLDTRNIRVVGIGEESRPFSEADVIRFKSDLIHPLAPGLLALQVHLEKTHGLIRQLVKRLRDVEAQIGHRAENQLAAQIDFERFEDLDLGLLSRPLSNLHYEALSYERTFSAIHGILFEMKLACDMDVIRRAAVIDDDCRTAFETSLLWRFKSTESLQEQMKYLLDRVRVQSEMVSNLRAHQDAQRGIRLASQSAAMAKAAKQDSFSMATVALMTMALLPATFFAALFAMPLFKWDEASVVQGRFWVYLAFALPSTLVVFMLWGVLTRNWIKKGARRGRALLTLLSPSKKS
ncbi:uncharacterized protein J7T54_004263 [Emericellopsis cladophorae]|uniref:Uncharacterized protein n=1 Tax=Emericellopsis cladophorae TaxID=2686198 RepID=A0A9P9XTV9_9HYPO|nr:uncharacterized protein J7T54_004263 [Emericellopsis cladophorae]KAI6777548.1 hypothetical protein J7T54_004263 [Emericellopsis cladophorae]